MNANRTMTWAGLLGIVLSTAVASEPARPLSTTSPVVKVDAGATGTLWLRPNPDFLRALGTRLVGLEGGRDQAAFELRVVDPLRIALGDGAPTDVVAGALELRAFTLMDGAGASTPQLRLVPGSATSLDWNLVDPKGAVWFRIVDGMRSPDLARDGIRLVTADLRAGPALAAWRDQEIDGRLVGNIGLRLPVSLPKQGEQPDSCAAPNWPGSPGFTTDVMLVDLNRVDVQRCRRVGSPGTCDGPGGLEGEVVFVPSATLRNRLDADAADVPWYTKFTGNFPPYGNDQHPYLVWNMYRFDADGRIEQIARSGLKHAFATANELCIDATCPSNGHVLGRGCQDLYNAGSNDLAFALSPRAELIPATGIWGRCGSIFDDILNSNGDPGCDAEQDSGGGQDGYQYRMVVRETQVDPALHPGATFYIDAWYLVRGDVDIFNTMGYRSVRPTYTGNPTVPWSPGALGAFTVGPVIDRWVADAGAAEYRSNSPLRSSEGQLRVASRVRRLDDGRFRYDYAIVNFDFSRAVVDAGSSEPNLRIVRNHGLSAIHIPLQNGALVDESEYRDGDVVAGNDWTGVTTSAERSWTAPAGATLDWGSLVFLRVISPHAPSIGAVRLDVAEAGTPGSFDATAWVPDADRRFADGFE